MLEHYQQSVISHQVENLRAVGWKRGRLEECKRLFSAYKHPQRALVNRGIPLKTLGFTITELLLVLTLIGVLSAISMPALKGFAATRRLKASAATLQSLLTFARDMAITDRTTYLVVFDLDNDRYWLASSETFNPSNPLRSALTAQNSTALAAIQNNINVTPPPQRPQLETLRPRILCRVSVVSSVYHTQWNRT